MTLLLVMNLDFAWGIYTPTLPDKIDVAMGIAAVYSSKLSMSRANTVSVTGAHVNHTSITLETRG